jgi:hypothetical protein
MNITGSRSFAASLLQWGGALTPGSRGLSAALAPGRGVRGRCGTLYVGSNDGNVYAIYTDMNCTCGAGTYLSSAPFIDCSSLTTACPPCGIGFYCPYIPAPAPMVSLCKCHHGMPVGYLLQQPRAVCGTALPKWNLQ